MWMLFIVTIAVFLMLLRAFLVVIGAYKDPILDTFSVYGEEQIISPLFSVLLWLVLFAYVSLFWIIDSGIVFGAGLVISIPVLAFRDAWHERLHTHATIFRAFPRWYRDIAEQTDREERRRIAYLWLRLPAKTRMLYNAHSPFFWQWVDQVLLTISR